MDQCSIQCLINDPAPPERISRQVQVSSPGGQRRNPVFNRSNLQDTGHVTVVHAPEDDMLLETLGF